MRINYQFNLHSLKVTEDKMQKQKHRNKKKK